MVLTALIGCKQTQADRFERYLEEARDSSGMEYITPAKDSVVIEEAASMDHFDDDDGIYTIPDIPQERSVDMGANSYELDKMMMGRE